MGLQAVITAVEYYFRRGKVDGNTNMQANRDGSSGMIIYSSGLSVLVWGRYEVDDGLP